MGWEKINSVCVCVYFKYTAKTATVIKGGILKITFGCATEMRVAIKKKENKKKNTGQVSLCNKGHREANEGRGTGGAV